MPSTTLDLARRFLTRSAAAFIAVICVLGAMDPVPAIAAPAGPTIDAEHLEIMAEQYNLARLKVERATAALEATDRRIAAAQLRVRLVQARTRRRAASLYLGAGAATALPIGDANHVADLRRQSRYLDAAEAPDRVLLTSLHTEMNQLAAERANQRSARDVLRHNAAAAAQMKRRLESLAAQAAAAARATAAAAAAKPPAPAGVTASSAGTRGTSTPLAPPSGTTPGTNPHPGPPSSPPPTTPRPGPAPNPPPTGAEPPVSPSAGAAVAFARAQLGKPYAFATAGPNTFDCSGLTMAAWASVGVRMPHYSGSQASMFPRVAFAQLKPGDIVVFYGDLHHVGLYIGGGMMIHAPQTGDVVKIAPAWRDTFQWGVRPR